MLNDRADIRFACAAYRVGLPISRRLLFATALVLSQFAAPALAATLTWVGATGNWSVANNWSPAQTPVTGDDLVLRGAPSYNDLVGVQLHSLTATSNIVGSIGGNPISFQSGATISNMSTYQLDLAGGVALNGPMTVLGVETVNFISAITGTGGLTIATPGMHDNLAVPSSYSGPTTIIAGSILSCLRPNVIPAGSSVTVNGTLECIGTFASLAGTGQVVGGGTVGDATSTDFSGVILDPSALTKVGTGTLTLSGANTYTGATTVNAGRLNVNGSLGSATTPTTVASGATLGGTGTISNSVSIYAGGTLSPGLTVGVLTTGNLTFVSGSFLAAQINGATAVTQYTQVNATGTANLGGATLQLTLGFTPLGGQQFTILTAAGGVSGSFSSVVAPPGYVFTPTYNANSVVLTVATVPGAPSIRMPTFDGRGYPTISFTAPLSNGGTPITRYTVTCNPGALTASGSGSPITVTGMQSLQTYACSVQATNVVGTGPPSDTVSVYIGQTPDSGMISKQDMWWNPSENGWGMSLIQHNDVLFGAFYIYNSNGNPTWVVMPGGSWDSAHAVYTGSVYQPTGAPFFAYNAQDLRVGSAIGTVAITFQDSNNAIVDYTIGGVTGRKFVTREIFANGDALAPVRSDLWWGGSSENGWGVTILQQSSTLFAVWYTYDANGNSMWYVMPGGAWTSSDTYEGALYRTMGAPWAGRSYDSSKLQVINAGTYKFQFTGENATFSYSADGYRAAIPLSREPF